MWGTAPTASPLLKVFSAHKEHRTLGLSFALSFGLCDTDSALTSTSPRAGKTRAQPGETQGCPSVSAGSFGGYRSM